MATTIHKVVEALLKATKPLTSKQVATAIGGKEPTTSSALWLAVRRGWVTSSCTASESSAVNPAVFLPRVKSVDQIPSTPWANSRKKPGGKTRGVKVAAEPVTARLRVTVTVRGEELELSLGEANKLHSELTAILDVSTHP
jgi:hypothetical protein